MKKPALLCIVIFLSVVSPIMALGEDNKLSDVWNGSTLLKYCSPIKKTFCSDKAECSFDLLYINSCMGYIRGLRTSSEWIAGEEGLQPYFCIPSIVDTEQLTFVVLEYLEEHPEKFHFSSIGLVYAAFRESFPCP